MSDNPVVYLLEARRNSQERRFERIDSSEASFSDDVRHLNLQLGWTKYRQRMVPVNATVKGAVDR